MRERGIASVILLLIVILIGAAVYVGYSANLFTFLPTDKLTNRPTLTPDTFANWLKYSNSKYQFELEYPPKTKLVEVKGEVYGGVDILYIGKNNYEKDVVTTDGYILSVSVYSSNSEVNPMPDSRSPLNSFDSYDNNKCYADYTCSDLTTVQIDGNTARTYSLTKKNTQMAYYIFQKANFVYYIFTNYAGSDDYKRPLERILSTIKFTSKK